MMDNNVQCKDCLHTQSISNYNTKLESAKDSVRFGYQYRKRQEYDDKNNPNSKKSYYLKEFNDVFAFIGLAAISGIAGNFAYDKLKQALINIFNNPLIIEIEDKEFQSFLKSKIQQKKFLRYIEEYRDKKVTKPKKKRELASTQKNKKKLK